MQIEISNHAIHAIRAIKFGLTLASIIFAIIGGIVLTVYCFSIGHWIIGLGLGFLLFAGFFGSLYYVMEKPTKW
jgi:hypothetical protein